MPIKCVKPCTNIFFQHTTRHQIMHQILESCFCDLPCSSYFVMFFIYVKTPVKSLPVSRLRNLYTSLILTIRITVKGKGEVQSGSRYNSSLSLTSALDGSGCSTPRPGRFTSVKETRYPLYTKLGGFHGRSGRVRKMSPPGCDPRTVRSVASGYTRCTIPAHTPFMYKG